MTALATLALAALLALSGFTAPPVQDDELASPKLRIEWARFKSLYDRQAVVVIDVRESVSYDSGHIPGARSIPLAEIERRSAEVKALGKPIVLYCA